jgi:hypothetical protein
MDAQERLAQRVAALCQRLSVLGSAPAPGGCTAVSSRVQQLEQVCRHIAEIQRSANHLDTTLADTAPAAEPPAPATLPRQLAWRTRRLLVEGRALLDELKALGERWVPDDRGEHDPLDTLYQQTAALAELALRAVQTFPEAVSEQRRLCGGLEAALGVVRDRVAGLRVILDRRRREAERVEGLAHLLTALVQNRPVLWKAFEGLAEDLLAEADDAAPLRWPGGLADRPGRWAAAHALTAARVVARVVPGDPAWRGRAADAVLAALVYDAGMAALPAELLAKPGPLDDDERRQIEAHAGLGAEALRRAAPHAGWLIEAVRAHHERLDGTGYPAGLEGDQIPPLARLLAVCDVYTALASPRAHRPAMSPRSALTHTLAEAESGRLDLEAAGRLLAISFYPVGSVVELSDGSLGIVVASHTTRPELTTPTRPVVQVVAGEGGQPLPWPEHVNLAQVEGRHIVRGLTAEEGRTLLGARHWHLL